MNSDQCLINRQVALVGEKAPLRRGTIVGPVTPHPTLGDVVLVAWDDGISQKLTPRSLLTSEEADDKEAAYWHQKFQDRKPTTQTRPNVPAVILDAKIEQAIQDKLDKASKLILEADKLAKKAGATLPELPNVVSYMLGTLYGVGWIVSGKN